MTTDDPMTLAMLVIGLVVFYFLWPKPDFTFRVNHGKAQSTGKLPVNLRQVLEEFLTQELDDNRTFKVHGTWRKKRLQLDFRGDLTKGERQRIRNLLTNS
jgi:hypothetical protein